MPLVQVSVWKSMSLQNKKRLVEGITENELKNWIIPTENALIYLNKFDQQIAETKSPA